MPLGPLDSSLWKANTARHLTSTPTSVGALQPSCRLLVARGATHIARPVYAVRRSPDRRSTAPRTQMSHPLARLMDMDPGDGPAQHGHVPEDRAAPAPALKRPRNALHSPVRTPDEQPHAEQWPPGRQASAPNPAQPAGPSSRPHPACQRAMAQEAEEDANQVQFEFTWSREPPYYVQNHCLPLRRAGGTKILPAKQQISSV